MNNYRLSTNKSPFRIEKITQSLINTVLDMKDIYIVDKEGLRIKASNGSLISSQLFVILALDNTSGKTLRFKNSQNCADYFRVTSNTINIKIAKKQPILDPKNHVEYILLRKSI